MSERILVVGRGGHARMIADVARSLGMSSILVEATGLEELQGAREAHGVRQCIVGVGFGPVRARLCESAEQAGLALATLVHQRAYVASDVELGAGTVVMPGAIVGVGTIIGRGVIVNTGASVDHDCRLGDFAAVAPGATLSGGVTIGEFAWIGTGASVIQNVAIGADTVIGAGAAVTTDIGAGVVAMGVPCQVARARRREDPILSASAR